jgi:hypothetical protein
MKRFRLRNVTPFTLDGWPLDALDQETIVELRKLSDQTGWTLAEVMRKMAHEYMANVRAETELKKKIIWLPINAHLRSSPAQR